ncbi:MAG: RidA family protein [Bacteroidia bacterium]|nr:RidA family protein [Bacteroidia bacterium]
MKFFLGLMIGAGITMVIFILLLVFNKSLTLAQNTKTEKSMATEKNIILTDKAPAPIGPYSQAVQVGNMLFVSGQIAINPANNQLVMDDIKLETQMVMKNIEGILKKAGYSFENVVKSTIFLTNMDNFAAVNEVYGSYFPNNPPARETVQVSKLPKNVNVEISVIAVK